MKDSFRLGITLTVICAIAAAVLAFTYSVTKNQIEMQKKIKQDNANKEAFKGADKFVPLKTSIKFENELDKVFEADKNSNKKGYVFLLHPRGYGGPIEMVVGVDLDGKVLGISIVSNNETPGLGAGIIDPKFQKQFKGKSSSDKLEVGQDIDGLTGATISSKAVTKAVSQAVKNFAKLK